MLAQGVYWQFIQFVVQSNIAIAGARERVDLYNTAHDVARHNGSVLACFRIFTTNSGDPHFFILQRIF